MGDRIGVLSRLVRDPLLQGRLLYGTDMPLPQTPVESPLFHARALGWARAMELTRIANPWDRDLLLKQALGVPEAVFSLPGRMLVRRRSEGAAH